MNNRLIITPKNDAEWLALRLQDVTSTESSALFGMSPYATAFELWHRKHDVLDVAFEDSERTDWGKHLQAAIAEGIGASYGVVIRPMTEYIRIVDARMGASFDFEIVGLRDPWQAPAYIKRNPLVLRDHFSKYGNGILEIKNVDRSVFREKWIVDENKDIEAPAHIEIQVQHQAHVAEREWSAIGVLVGGNRPIIIPRVRDRKVGEAIEARIRSFWQSQAENTPPQPNYATDAAFICDLYDYAEPGRVFDGRGREDIAPIVAAYREASLIEKQAKEDKDIAKAKLYEIIGDAERATFDDFSLWAGLVAPAHVEYDRKGYRGFKLTASKKGS